MRYSVWHGEERPIWNTVPLTKKKRTGCELVVVFVLVAPGDSRQGTAGAKISGRDHKVGVSAKQKHVKNKQTSKKKTNLKLKFGRLWTVMRSTCFLKGQFTNTKSRVERVVSKTWAGRIVARGLQLWWHWFSRRWAVVLHFPPAVEQQQLHLLFNRCASCHSLKIKRGPPNFRQAETIHVESGSHLLSSWLLFLKMSVARKALLCAQS